MKKRLRSRFQFTACHCDVLDEDCHLYSEFLFVQTTLHLTLLLVFVSLMFFFEHTSEWLFQCFRQSSLSRHFVEIHTDFF